MTHLFRILAGILLVLAPYSLTGLAPLSAFAETVEEVEEPASTPGNSESLGMDLHQDVPNDTYGVVTRFDPHDFEYHPEDKSFTIVFWADGLNGSWIADESEGAPTPPFRVFVGRLPEGSVDKKYLNNKWREPECYPLLTESGEGLDGDKVPRASPDNVAWAFRIKGRGTKVMSFNIRMVDASGKSASGNVIQKSDFYIGGAQTRYQFKLDFDHGTVKVTS